MIFRKSSIALGVTVALAATAHAQSNTTQPDNAPNLPQLSPVIVTGNPLGSELFDMVTPASALDGKQLLLRRQSTLGETIDGLPGVSSTYYGPNVSRPVIRGLDGDHVRILQNGSGSLDASSLSFDHAVPIDPLIVDRIEVVRGPAALLYGGSAVGGVVNTIDNRIPREAIDNLGFSFEGRFGGAADERGGAAILETGNSSFALHADVYGRDTDDLRIKGPNISPRLQAQDPTLTVVNGTLPNSASSSNGGALGASLTSDRGYLGLSYSNFDAQYGTVAEPGVTIDMQSNRWDVAGEARDLGKAVETLKFSAQHTDYLHQELDAGVPATIFKNNGYEARLEAVHGKLGLLKGSVGIQVANFDFSALGDEAFVPSTNTDSKAVFIYEELPLDQLKFTFGARHERSEIDSVGGGPIDPNTGLPRFDPAASRSFGANSGALGVLYSFTDHLALAVNGAYTERAPTFYELFADGVHAATGAYEIGNATFDNEKSKSIDVALRMHSGAHSGSIGVYRTRFDNYITLFNTGNTRGGDGELNPVDGDGNGVADGSGEEILAEQAYRAVPAIFRGFEAQGKFRVMGGAATLDLLPHLDYVRAEDETTGQPLPRIAPLRIGVGLDYQRDVWGANADLTRVDGQDHISANELPTDGYTMLNAAITYHIKDVTPQGTLDVFLKGTNLLDEDARNHVSILKDIAPLRGRAVMVGLRGNF